MKSAAVAVSAYITYAVSGMAFAESCQSGLADVMPERDVFDWCLEGSKVILSAKKSEIDDELFRNGGKEAVAIATERALIGAKIQLLSAVCGDSITSEEKEDFSIEKSDLSKTLTKTKIIKVTPNMCLDDIKVYKVIKQDRSVVVIVITSTDVLQSSK